MNHPIVFIADDDLAIINSLSTRCQAKGFRTQTATDASAAWLRIDRCRPDLIVLDVNMPCGNGLSVMEMIRTHDALADIPVILLTGRTDEATQRRCHEHACYYVPKGGEIWSRVEPILDEHLLAPKAADPAQLADPVEAPAAEAGPLELMDAVFEAIGVNDEALWSEAPEADQPADHTPWVLSIDDDRQFAEGLLLRLKTQGVGFRRAFDGEDGCRKATTMSADVILLDYEMPQASGPEVLRRLKADPRTARIPVISLTGRNDPVVEAEMLGLGAEAFFTKPYDWPTLWATIEPLLRSSSAPLTAV
ncbi:MAG: response regulator [Planctomycetota bacterium]